MLAKILAENGIDTVRAGPPSKTLKKEWFFRAVDLRALDDETLDRMAMPARLKNMIRQVRTDIADQFADFVEEVLPNHADMRGVLQEMVAENDGCDEAVHHVDHLTAAIEERCLLRAQNLRRLRPEDWFGLDPDAPVRLVHILIEKLHVCASSSKR